MNFEGRRLEDILRSRTLPQKVDYPSTRQDHNVLPPEGDGALTLDVTGILDGGDKASVRGEVIGCSWDYLRHFGSKFASLRGQAINLIEIGVAMGNSVTTWSRYFPAATIVGLDIDPGCARFERGAIKIRIGSQDDEAFLCSVIADYPPTIIIDDGSHLANHIIKSFEVLFPHVLPGGFYVIEDVGLHFIEDTLDFSPRTFGGEQSLFPYFMRLIAAKAAHRANLGAASLILNAIYREIDEISIVGGAIIIRKRAERDLGRYIDTFEEELHKRTIEGVEQYYFAALRYSEFLITYGIALDRAEELLGDILKSQPENRRTAGLLYSMLNLLGRDDDARKVRVMTGATEEELTLPTFFCQPWVTYPHR